MRVCGCMQAVVFSWSRADTSLMKPLLCIQIRELAHGDTQELDPPIK
jgi:hypothetical protein